MLNRPICKKLDALLAELDRYLVETTKTIIPIWPGHPVHDAVKAVEEAYHQHPARSRTDPWTVTKWPYQVRWLCWCRLLEYGRATAMTDWPHHFPDRPRPKRIRRPTLAQFRRVLFGFKRLVSLLCQVEADPNQFAQEFKKKQLRGWPGHVLRWPRLRTPVKKKE